MMQSKWEKPLFNKHQIVTCIVVAWLFVVSVLSFSDHAALSDLYQQSSRTDEEAKIATLQIDVSELTQQMDELSRQQRLVFNVEEKLLSLERSVQQMRDQQQSQNISDELSRLNQRLDGIDEQIKALQQIPKTVQPINPASKETPKPRSYPEADFVLLGVELRGAQQLLSVAPKGSRSIGEIRLLQIGDTVGDTVGAWQLKAFDNTQATFTSNGRSKTFTIPGGE